MQIGVSALIVSAALLHFVVLLRNLLQHVRLASLQRRYQSLSVCQGNHLSSTMFFLSLHCVCRGELLRQLPWCLGQSSHFQQAPAVHFHSPENSPHSLLDHSSNTHNHKNQLSPLL